MNQKAPEQTASHGSLHQQGVDGHLVALAWCSCGWNRTKATRARGRAAIERHVRDRAEMARRFGWHF